MERGFGMNIHTTLCKTDNQQGPTVYHNTQYSVITYMRKESEKECITVSLFCIPETNTTLYIHSTAIFFCKSVNGEKYTMLTLTERKKRVGEKSEVKWSEVKLLSRVRLFATWWTVAYQAPLSMGFSRQKYWSGLPFPSPGDLPDPGIEPGFPTLEADALTSEPPGKPQYLPPIT